MRVEIPPERPRVHTVLADGSAATLLPFSPDDRQYLVEGLAEMSMESRFSRFGQGRQNLTAGEWDYLSEVDQHRHVAWVAVVEGNGAGVGRYIVGPECAEVAITVLDRYQGRGVGTALFVALVAVARADGVAELCFEVLPTNRKVLEALAGVHAEVVESGGLVEGRVAVADLPVDPQEADYATAMAAFRA
jgi:GNAT superfamily N-acetyltransferase